MLSKIEVKNLIASRVNYIDEFVTGYSQDEIFVTTSLNKESMVLLYLLEEAGLVLNTYFVKTGLSIGNIDENIDKFQDTFSHKLKVVDSTDICSDLLKGRVFLDIHEQERNSICKILKKDSLMKALENSRYKMWINGTRMAETEARKTMKAVSFKDNYLKFSPTFTLNDSEMFYVLKILNFRLFSDLEDLCKKNSNNECGLHL